MALGAVINVRGLLGNKNLVAQASSTSKQYVNYPDDAAYASSEGAPVNGSVYYNTTYECVRTYIDGVWANDVLVVPDYGETDDKSAFKSLMNNLDTERKKVVWVGDSIVEQGNGVVGNGIGFTSYLENYWPKCTYVNAGIGAQTTLDIIARLPALVAEAADMYFVAIGLNDVRYFNASGAQTPAEWITNISTIHATLSAGGAKVVFANIWPTYWKDGFRTSSKKYTDERTAYWNSLLAEYCYNNQLLCLDAHSVLKAYINVHNVQTLIPDGTHPDVVGTAGKKLYADAVISDEIQRGKYLAELEVTGRFYYKLVIYDNTNNGAINTGGIIALQNIGIVPVERFGLTANAAFSNITGLFGVYNPAYIGFYSKANDWPLILTFSTDGYPTDIPVSGVVSLLGVNRGIRVYELYYSSDEQALTEVDHPSWKLVSFNYNTAALATNVYSLGGARLYYQLLMNNVGNAQPRVQLKQIGNRMPNKVFTQNVPSTSKQRFDLLFSSGIVNASDALLGVVPGFAVQWEAREAIETLLLDSFNSSLNNWTLKVSSEEVALTNPYHASWRTVYTGQGNGTFSIKGQPMEFLNLSANPSTPSANFVKLYAKNNRMYVMDSTAKVTELEMPLTVVDHLDGNIIDASTIDKTAVAYTTVVASLAGLVRRVQIFDTAGINLGWYNGANTLLFVSGPGTNESTDIEIPAGTALKVRPLQASATDFSGNYVVNFLG